MVLAFASDHAGFELKQHLIEFSKQQGISVVDLGTHSAESVDYPDYGHSLAAAVLRGEASLGVAICGLAALLIGGWIAKDLQTKGRILDHHGAADHGMNVGSPAGRRPAHAWAGARSARTRRGGRGTACFSLPVSQASMARRARACQMRRGGSYPGRSKGLSGIDRHARGGLARTARR
jgi:hypothetical protein